MVKKRNGLGWHAMHGNMHGCVCVIGVNKASAVIKSSYLHIFFSLNQYWSW